MQYSTADNIDVVDELVLHTKWPSEK